MNPSAIFIQRPVATTLLTIGIALSGIVAFKLLPVSPLPQVDFPTISVSASLPGASPETMASSVATPLERSLGTIAGITEMTSSSSLGSARVTLVFDLNRDIDGAARDVQAAINAARSLLPSGLPSNPTYRKVNPSDAPIMILSLTSDTMTQGQMYDAADTILAQKISQLSGIGQVTVGGSSRPAVRVELNPDSLNKYQIGPEDVRTAITSTNANRPKGSVETATRHWQIYANDQAKTAAEYLPLIVAWRDGAPVRLSDVSTVRDSVQDVRNAGTVNGKPAIALVLFKQPGANIIETVDRVRALLPSLRASIPAAIDLNVALDRSPTIRASLFEVERTLLISIGLVILVVFLFLRNGRATFIPSVAVPVSLIGTFGVMYLCGFTLDSLSLMALTVATGFVVDDAIVVLENISRHLEAGMEPFAAALRGAREVGFTVMSISISLIAVFIPILMMGGIVGRLFREFSVTLSVAILVSLMISLTTTPMMCARLLKKHDPDKKQGWFFTRSEKVFASALRNYERSLAWALEHSLIMMLILFATIVLNVYLYIIVPKGFFPQQDTGRIVGNIQADQAISFQLMRTKLTDFASIVQADPAVDTVTAFTGGGQRNTGNMFISLKPLSQRKLSIDGVIARLRAKLAKEPGASLFLVPVQDIRVGGRQANAQYQYTLQGDDLDVLNEWEPKIRFALSNLPELVDVNTDQQQKGLQTSLVIDRDTASRLQVTPKLIDTTLADLFGQSQVSTIYNPLNQYKVVLEAAPQYWQAPEILKKVFVAVPAAGAATAITNTSTATPVLPSAATLTTQTANAAAAGGSSTASSAISLTAGTTTGSTVTPYSSQTTLAPKSTLIPLSAFAHFEMTNTALAVNHQAQFVASTISFNLPENVSLDAATVAIDRALSTLGVPTAVHGSFQGTAAAFKDSLSSEPILILTALLTVYIVLGMLYESTVHPITILSTLPSAGVGALLALLITGTDFSIIALIGVILLIGIVKKNAIMMIDFALAAERGEGLSPRDAIFKACTLRFRPIMMTTMAALFGAIPLALGTGDGAELRQPLGVSIVGGLIVSQVLTLYTTPVVYLVLDEFRLWSQRQWKRSRPLAPGSVPVQGNI